LIFCHFRTILSASLASILGTSRGFSTGEAEASAVADKISEIQKKGKVGERKQN